MAKKELGYVELEWTCPACQTRNPGAARKCSQCGAPMPETTQFEQAPEEKLITDAAKITEAQAGPDIYCAYCGTRNASTAQVCKQCGAQLAEGKKREAGQVLGGLQAAPAPPVTCPACGAENPALARLCAKCGAPLAKAAPTTSTQPAAPGCSPIVWIALAALGVLAIILFFALGARTKSVVGDVWEVYWQRKIAVEVLTPVTREGWRSELPAGVETAQCRQEVYRTQSQPAPGAREVCGTPYVVDQGSGYGKVMQDCQYQILADYCLYKTLAWVPGPPIVLEGKDLAPEWPNAAVTQSQRLAGRSESYIVAFNVDGKVYRYTPGSEDAFHQFTPGSQWQLTINGFGDVTAVRAR